MAATFYILSLVDVGAEITQRFWAAIRSRKHVGQSRSQRVIDDIYSEMFPQDALFEEPYTLTGCFWTFKYTVDKLKILLNGSVLPLSNVVKLLTDVVSTDRIVDHAIVKQLVEKRRETTYNVEVYEKLIETEEGLNKLVSFYTARKNRFEAFLRLAVKHGSDLEVSLNL